MKDLSMRFERPLERQNPNDIPILQHLRKLKADLSVWKSCRRPKNSKKLLFAGTACGLTANS